MNPANLTGESYIDTSAFIAFCDRSDSYHDDYLRLFSEPPPLVTSSLVRSSLEQARRLALDQAPPGLVAQIDEELRALPPNR